MQPLRISPAASRRALQQLFHTRPPPLRQPKLQQASLSTKTSTATRQAASSIIPRRPTTWTQRVTSRTCRTSRRYNSSSSSSSAASEQPLSFSQRMKKLSREYGWAAVGVYFALSALDFPFCFLAVRTLGTDRIGHWEHVIVSTIKQWIPLPIPDGHSQHENKSGSSEVDEAEEHVDHGYKEAEAANRGSNASIWTQLALAYAIHKSFIFIRVPLTATVTPKVVKTLRGWGWNIGKMPKRSPKTVD